MRVHVVGVCGTGMASLAGLLCDLGHNVSGSDLRFDPPMGTQISALGIATNEGWDPSVIGPHLDVVVVGNVSRSNNPEAVAALEQKLRVWSLPQALRELVLAQRTPLVIAGTHGKTTTTTLVHHLLSSNGVGAGAFIGGVATHLGRSYTLGDSNSSVARSPFVLEGDEYDSAFFLKEPKFWHYGARSAVLTSIEHDHIDIYPDEASYIAAFEGFVHRLPKDGVLVAWAGCPTVRTVAAQAACRVVYYALDGDDCADVTPTWLAAPAQGTDFDLFVGGSACGRARNGLIGEHNLRNAVAAIALCAELKLVSLRSLLQTVSTARGSRRRQEWVGDANGVSVYDDFAHHPTAVDATLRAFRRAFPSRRLLAVFEPRSATASRAKHQQAYPDAFLAADTVVLAPVGRAEIDASERLDTKALAQAIEQLGTPCHAARDLDDVVGHTLRLAKHDDIIVCMSNGRFGDVPDRLVVKLAERA